VKKVEIYGLYDPDSGELRYVGKANNAQKRLKTHILDRHLKRPVCRWINSLVEHGKAPVMRVLETCPSEQWEETERRLIAEYRKTGALLNLADGGSEPFQTKEQRQQAAKASNAAQKQLHPALLAVRKANFEMSRLHAKFVKDKSHFHAYLMKFWMRCYAADPTTITPASWLTL
jgi:hypothetical protein